LITARAVEAIETSDTDDLIRVIDGLCASGAWDDLVELQERCGEAVGRGKQLWGVEEHIRYRLALEAPGPWSGASVSQGVARFALGPLPEVAASTKTWDELSPYLEDGPWRGVVAAERVVRAEEVDEVVDLPGRLLEWEPIYPVATYKADKVEAPSPAPPAVHVIDLPDAAATIEDIESEAALADLVQPWITESNGRASTVTVDGDAPGAIRALGLREGRTADLVVAEAMAWMAWAGASGGAHGRRRGAAAGRYGAWWTIATICDLDWPVDPETITAAVTGLEFVWFDDGSPGTGWELRLAIANPEEGLAWAISAVDQSD
jgi:hypothetical protein